MKYIIINSLRRIRFSQDFFTQYGEKIALFVTPDTTRCTRSLEHADIKIKKYTYGKNLGDFLKGENISQPCKVICDNELFYDEVLKLCMQYNLNYELLLVDKPEIFYKKFEMKKFLQDKIPVPRQITMKEECQLGKTYISRPSYSNSSHHICLFTKKEAPNHFNENYIVEEYIQGHIYHVDFLLSPKSLFILGTCRLHHPPMDYVDLKPLIGYLEKDKKIRSIIEAYVTKLMNLYKKAPSGAYHVEVILEKLTLNPYLIEINARPPGAMIPDMYQQYYGINLYEINALIQMGEDIPIIDQKNLNKKNIVWAWFYSRKGTVQKIELFDTSRSGYSLLHEKAMVKKGDKVNATKSILDFRYSVMVECGGKNKNFLKEIEKLSKWTPVTTKS